MNDPAGGGTTVSVTEGSVYVEAGGETTVVRVDRRRTYLVTNTMLGSGEGYRVGVYNLKLGALKKGRHSIELTVEDDGKGNATYQWDALSLYAE